MKVSNNENLRGRKTKILKKDTHTYIFLKHTVFQSFKEPHTKISAFKTLQTNFNHQQQQKRAIQLSVKKHS